MNRLPPRRHRGFGKDGGLVGLKFVKTPGPGLGSRQSGDALCWPARRARPGGPRVWLEFAGARANWSTVDCGVALKFTQYRGNAEAPGVEAYSMTPAEAATARSRLRGFRGLAGGEGKDRDSTQQERHGKRARSEAATPGFGDGDGNCTGTGPWLELGSALPSQVREPSQCGSLAEARVQGTSGGRTDMQHSQGGARQGQVPSTQDAQDLGTLCFSCFPSPLCLQPN